MTTSMTATETQPQYLRSAGAVFAGFVAVFVLSLGTDQVLHTLKVYPPWGQPTYDPRLNALALAYRIVYGVAGSYLTARLAPRNPMRHAMVGGLIGFVSSTAGGIAAMSMADLGPKWYPIALALTALPCAWLGGALYLRGARSRRPAANPRP
jgi:hypothetical protein